MVQKLQKKLLVLIITLVVFLSVFSIIFNTNVKKGVSSATAVTQTSVSADDDLILSKYLNEGKGKAFNKDVFVALIKAVSGEDNLDLSTLGESPRTFADWGNNAIVTMGGAKWVATYLSQNSKGEPILTLWYLGTTNGNTVKTAKWKGSGTAQNVDATYPDNMYSTSWIRANALNNGGIYKNGSDNTSTATQSASSEWAIYTMDKTAKTGSIKEFLEVPNNMSWQLKQKNSENNTGASSVHSNYAANTNNDALDLGGEGSANSYLNKTGYKAWGEDTLWLPSLTETGGVGESAGMWKLNANIRSNSADSWVRSANAHHYHDCLALASNGASLKCPNVDGTGAVRPALHLNLISAYAAAGYLGAEPPTNVESVYNGKNLTIADITKGDVGWYDPEIMDLIYPNEMINVGTYTVTAKIKDEVYENGDGTTFTDEYNSQSLAFQYKINKKPIEVVANKQADGKFKAEVQDATDTAWTLSDSDWLPVFGVNYTSSDGKGYTFNHPTKPNKVGVYNVTAVITNPEKCNFIIDEKKVLATYIHSAEEIKKPTVSLPANPYVYKKAGCEYNVSNYDSSKMTIKLPNGVLYNEKTEKITVSRAGTFEVAFELKIPAETCWEGDNSTSPVKVTITVKKKPISVPTFNAAMVNSTDVKNATSAKVPASAIVDVEEGDVYPNVLIMFGYEDGTGSSSNRYPTDTGKYKATLEIENPDTCNYELDAATAALVVNFAVTGAVSFEESDIVWIATPNAGGAPITLKAPYELPFIVGGYTISINNVTAGNVSLKNKGVKIFTDGTDNGYSEDINQTGVGTYTAKVRLVNFDDTYDIYDKTFSLSWKITPHKVTKPTYSGDDITFSKDPTDLATLFGLPSDWATYVNFEIEKNGEPFTGTSISDKGTYNIIVKLKSEMSGNVTWSDDTRGAVSLIVKINPRTVEITGWDSSSDIPKPLTASSGDDAYLQYIYTKIDGTEVDEIDVLNSVNTTFNVKAMSKYGDNVIVATAVDIADNETFSTPGNPSTPPTTVAKPMLVESSKTYTGETVIFELNGYNASYMQIINGSLSVIDVKEYFITIAFKDGANYCWTDGTRTPITLTFSVVEASEPTPPPIKDGENNILKKIKDLIDSGFPLWQICTMAVAGLLTVIFLIKSIQYGNRRKKLVAKSKKNAVKVAGLMPIFSTEVVLAGLSNQIWSIMAFAFVGLALLMFIVALITRRAWKKAEAAQEEGEGSQLTQIMQALQSGNLPVPVAQTVDNSSIIEEMRRQMEAQRREDEARRREDEERHRAELDALREEQARRDEEQAKRDEAMKLMLANMMGRQQGIDNGDMPYYGTVDDTDLLVQKVIAGLLPAVQQMIPDNTAYLTAPAYEQSEEIKALTDEVKELKNQLAKNAKSDSNVDVDDIVNKVAAQITPASQGNVNLDDLAQKVSEKITPTTTNTTIVQGATVDEVAALNDKIAQMQQRMDNMAYLSADEYDDDDFDDEEEWDSILDEEDDDFVEAVIIEEDGTVKKTSPNFRMRLKQSSDKNREWYTVIKNMFCSQKGVTYRVCKRVEKIRYQGQVVGVIGIAKRSIKLWLALKPYEYDARRYHHKDVSDKPRFVDVPMYVRVGSDRALTRAQELILALFQELNMEARKRYNDRSIQELIFTLKHNKLLTNKQNKQLLCEVMHVHDCNVLDDETAEKCIETKNVAELDDSLLATVKLDDIDAAFQDGNRVTLEKLKKVGLVSEECTGYTVTADKRLTKPLIIVANDFSLTAVKLITLTGGRAIKLQQV